MKLELQPITVEKAIEALETMYEQTGKISYSIAYEAIKKSLEDARAKTKQEQPSLFA